VRGFNFNRSVCQSVNLGANRVHFFLTIFQPIIDAGKLGLKRACNADQFLNARRNLAYILFGVLLVRL